MKKMIAPLVAATFAVMSSIAPAKADESLGSRLNRLDAALRAQSETIKEQQKLIEELRNQLKAQQQEQQKQVLQAEEQKKVIEEVKEQQKEQQKVAQAEESSQIAQMAKKVTGLFGNSSASNPNISVVLDTKAYVSNLKNGQLEKRGVRGFTTQGLENHNGFNVKEAEVAFFAPVDPYFNLYVLAPINESGIDLEEAYFVTTALPEGFQVKGGRFKSNTSRLNSQHPHAWDFADIALPYRAFLGPEAIGGENGIQITNLLPTSVYTLIGTEVLQGNNDLLFGRNSNKGPRAFTAFTKLAFETSENSTLLFGPWAMFGSTTSDNVIQANSVSGNKYRINGDSQLYAMEAYWKWKDGKQALSIQSEYMFLRQHGSVEERLASDNSLVGPAGSIKREQDGFYIQSLYQYDRWRVGGRYDRLGIFSDTFERNGINETYSGKPWRATASLEFNPTEFTRIRAQFTHDNSSRDGRVNNEGILQAIFTIGAHGAHAF